MASAETLTTETSAARANATWINLRNISLGLVFVGLIVSGYLSYVKLTNVAMICVEGETFNCDAVQNSIYSEMFGIPIAYFGFATYIAIGALIVLQNRVGFLREYGMLLTFGLVLFAFLFSMYLIYVQGVLMSGTWCQWCLKHEAIMTVLFVATSIRLWRFLQGDTNA